MNFVDLERTRYVELRRRILDLHPEIDDQTLADTLEGATNLKEAIGAVIRSALDDEPLGKALKDRIEALRQGLSRIETRATGKRQAALLAMDQANLQKLLEADFTASLRLLPAGLEIADETKLPTEFLIPSPRRSTSAPFWGL